METGKRRQRSGYRVRDTRKGRRGKGERKGETKLVKGNVNRKGEIGKGDRKRETKGEGRERGRQVQGDRVMEIEKWIGKGILGNGHVKWRLGRRDMKWEPEEGQ